MNKRTTAFIAAAVMALSLAACGETSGESKSDKSAVKTTAETTAADDNAEANTNDEEDSAAESNAAESADSNGVDNASESSAQTDTAMGSDMTITDVDSFFASLDGKTLDEAKAYIESTFPVNKCEESANAYTIPDENGNAMWIDLYVWYFSSEKTIEGEAFDYVSISATNGMLFDASFSKENSDKTTYSLLGKKIEAYGYSTVPDSNNLYTMDCGTVHVSFVPSFGDTMIGNILISHEYAQQEIDSNE